MTRAAPKARLTRGQKDEKHPEAMAARARVADIIDQVAPADLIAAIKHAPSLRGMILGYIAEEMFVKHVLSHHDFNDVRKHDDHDREVNKADRDFLYKGKRYSVQLKSIQTNTVVWRNDLGCLVASVQNDGSDRRPVKLSGGKTVEATNYRVGDYDVLAVPLFPFTGQWNFAYMKNSDCRRTEAPKFAAYRDELLATTELLYFPLRAPWTTDLRGLLNSMRGRR